MDNTRPSKSLLIIASIFFVTMTYLALSTYVFDIRGTDYDAHLQIIRKATAGDHLPPHFLYHVTINVVTFFSGNVAAMQLASLLVLFVFTMSKIIVSAAWFETLNWRTLLMLVVIFFASPIMNWWQFPQVYLGQLTPTIWHNPTIIMSLPFCLLTLYFIFKHRCPILSSGFLMLATFAKPNFALCLIPGLVAFGTVKQLPWKDILIITVPAMVALLWQYLHLYFQDDGSSQLVLMPFAVWSLYSPSPWLSMLVSLAFPLAFTVLFFKQIKERKTVCFAWLLVVIAIVQFVLFAEQGERFAHANLYWGTVPSSYFLFLVLTVEFSRIKVFGERTFQARYAICALTLGAHAGTGILFYARTLQGLGEYA